MAIWHPTTLFDIPRIFPAISYAPNATDNDMLYLSTGRSPSQEPGSYCQLLIEELLLPVMEAARGIANQKAQLAFLLLTINVFLSRLRSTITAKKHMYRYVGALSSLHAC